MCFEGLAGGKSFVVVFSRLKKQKTTKTMVQILEVCMDISHIVGMSIVLVS